MTTATVSPAPAVSFLSSLVLSPEVAALLTASYGKGATPISAEKPATSKLAKAKRAKGEKSEKKPSTDIVWIVKPASNAKGQPIPQDGALFLFAMRAAGIRYVEKVNDATGEVRQVPIYDAKLHRSDAQYAVALFQGWTNEPWGTQVDRARAHAKFSLGDSDAIIRPCAAATPFGARWIVVGRTPRPRGDTALPHRSAEAHSARWTAEGWVKGMPDAFTKINADLEARERLAVHEFSLMSTLHDLAGKSRAKARADYEQIMLRLAKHDPGLHAIVEAHPNLLATMVAIAEQRLETVRRDIETFDFSDPAAVEKRYASLNMRGMPVLAEELSLMHQFSKTN